MKVNENILIIIFLEEEVFTEVYWRYLYMYVLYTYIIRLIFRLLISNTSGIIFVIRNLLSKLQSRCKITII